MLQDFIDMLGCLERKGVDYVIVGAFAMAHFGYVRATGDIDIFIAATDLNSRKMISALKEFGAPLFGIKEDYFSEVGNFLQVGTPPGRIDIINNIDGVSFQDAFASREIGRLGGVSVPFLGLDLLILNKESTGRDKDLPDANELKRIRESRKV